MKCHIKSLQKGSEADQYVVENLTWLGVYLRSTLSNTPLQKVLTLVPLIATGPEVFVATMTIFFSYYYDDLKDTLTRMKSLRLQGIQGRTLQIDVQKYWWILSALIVLGTSVMIA